MYASFPAFLYLNASLGGAMLVPLLEAQGSLTNVSYAAQDLGEIAPDRCHDGTLLTRHREGLNYPVASGAHSNPLEGIEGEENTSSIYETSFTYNEHRIS